MKAKVILFRADSSSSIGTGHIMRDLVLAKKYADKGAKIIFATQNLKGNINKKILDVGYKLVILKNNRKKELVKFIKKLSVDLLVIDHYDIDYKKEKYIKNKTDVEILAFDDVYNKHYCDILLNHNIYADKKRYEDLVPKWCKLLCGYKYTLIRDEFITAKQKTYKKSQKFTVFVAMGGADSANLNIDILKALGNFQNLKIYIVTTTANANLKMLKTYIKNRSYIKLYIDSTKVAKLMAKSDFAVVTPSGVLNEVFFMQLPFVAIESADNQHYMVEYLKRMGICKRYV